MDLFKGGWHPDKKGGGSGKGMGKGTSLRGDFKGVNQVAGWMGKGKDTSKEWEAGIEHHSAPLSTLKDPASFGPPPKHVHAHGIQSPSSSQPSPATGSSGYSRPSPQPPAQSSSGTYGGPVPPPQAEPEAFQYGDEAPAPPPIPYRADTTGLKTNNLPQPPTHQALVAEEPEVGPPAGQAAGKPRLPPRLPPRQNSHPDTYTPEPPPAYDAVSPQGQEDEYVNQTTAGRLAGAGVSVPGLGIGGRTGATSAQNSGTAPSHAGQMSELQARFAQMGRKGSPDGSEPLGKPTAGTTWSQKQAAMQTASNFRKDPSSVSMADARDAASTANSFRQRHGDQFASGLQSAGAIGQKYGVSDRLAGVPNSSSTASNGASAGVSKRPPPPPPKKKALQGDALTQEPPPIPHSSKPR